MKNELRSKQLFFHPDFKIQEIFPTRLANLKNKFSLLHSFVLGLQVSQEIVHPKCVIVVLQ